MSRIYSALAYLTGGTAILIGLLLMIVSPIGGGLIVLGGVISLPRTRRYIESNTTAELSRGSTIAVVSIAIIIGLGIALSSAPSTTSPQPAAEGGSSPVATTVSAATPTPTATPQIVTASSRELLPTIKDYGADWNGGIDSNRSSSFYNTQNDNLVIFNVTVLPDIGSAREQYRNQQTAVQNKGMGTESYDAGDEAFMYKPGKKYIVVVFRERNVIARVDFDARGSLLPETDSLSHVHRQEKAIENHLQ